MARTQIDPTLAPRIASTKNYISNSDAEFNATTGWAVYANTAQSTPVTGTGGSPNITLTVSNSAPLDGSYSFLITKDAANRQGQGTSYDFAIDTADQASVLAIQFNYNASANFVAGTAAPAVTNSDLTVWLYDITNATLIPVSPFTLQGNGSTNFVFRGVCQTASNSTSYRLIMHIATTNALAWIVKFDNVFVGRQPVLYGSPVQDTYSYTPSTDGVTPLSSSQVFSRRVGDHLEIWGQITGSAVNGNNAYLTIPSGLAIDLTKVASSTANQGYLGTWVQGNSTPASFYAGSEAGTLFCDGTDTSKMWITLSNQNLGFAKRAGTSILFANQPVMFQAKVPIAGWSSTVLMSNDTDTRVVAAQYFATAIVINNASNVQFNTKSIDTHGAVTTGTNWQFKAPVSGIYSIYGFIQPSSVSTSNIFGWAKNGGGNSIQLLSMTTNNQYYYFSDTQQLNAGDTLALNTSAGGFTFNAGEINFVRLTGPSSIAATETVACRYANETALVLNTSPQTILYQTKVIDTHSAFNTSTGIFTAPTSGTYLIMGKTVGTATASNPNNNMYLYAMKNGTLFQRDFWQFIVTNNAAPVILEVSALQSLVAGDQIKMQAFVDNAVTCTLSTDVNVATIDIVRVGN